MDANRLVCLFTLSLLALPLRAADAPPPMPPMPVEGVTVQPQPLQQTVEAVGSLVANETVVIRPEVAGRISRFGFTEGQPVKAGAVLVQLDDSVQAAQLQRAKATLDLAQADYQRRVDLLQKQLISQTEFDQTASQLKVAQADVALADAQLGKMRVRAPFDAVIGVRSVSPGAMVQAGQDLVTLVDVHPIKIDFRIPERYLASVQPQQDMQLTLDALPGRRFTGKVFAIDPQVDEKGRSLVLRAQVPNPKAELKPGLFARVLLVLASKPAALLVPEQALVPNADGSRTLFKVVDGKVTVTPVTVGVRRNGEVEITEGLAAGDVVITAGHMKIQPGAAVTVIPPTPARS
ncbi:efflux RND transporter periplasmic adaptor subunit [Permianibacter sp. IMCC34836]|uniref:efflux RND transporter periplasmic adaptor subunit n=1 Tax=Permianibacter fluminis TaxID=2738515 RepID=UPI00155559AB|nr:efflux RND transporter periplasmic adaptor subunit [Permianibacter fluminis]NQD35690.1 efflux RND transporter periplasmic adaptor subunit [Permianibacter fluminis]